MAYEVPSYVSNLVVFCFEECQIDCLFVIRLRLHMMKTANQEFNTFNEPLVYFYLIDVSFFVYIFPLEKCGSKINIVETLEDTEDIGFLILNQNELFIEEKNPSEELLVSEKEIAALDTSAMKETNVEDLPKLILINEKSGNMRVVVHEGGNTETTKSDTKSGELATNRCSFCGKCYKRELFYEKHASIVKWIGKCFLLDLFFFKCFAVGKK